MIVFVGAGPGAEDLITVRGQQYLKEADIIIYAGSLVNPGLLQVKKESCKVYNSAYMTLEEVLDVMYAGEKDGKRIVRLHTGRSCLYGAIREQMDALDEKKSVRSLPGGEFLLWSSGSAERRIYLAGYFTVCGDHQDGGKNAGSGERVHPQFCSSSGNDGDFFKYRNAGKSQKELMEGGYPADTPAAIVYKATWPEEKVLRCQVSELEQTAAEAQVTKTALIVVGRILEGEYQRSLLYHPEFTTEFRQGKQED